MFKAYTDPNLIPQWWGPKSLTTAVDKMDVRPGRVWRFVQRGPDGSEYAFNGVYREMYHPSGLSTPLNSKVMRGHVVLETVTFEEHDGKTKLTVTCLFETVEDRDGMLKSGMEAGAAESLNRLAEYLAKARV